MRTALLALFALCFCPYLARADTPDPPDVNGWVTVSSSRIEVRLSANAVIYLGIDAEYRNPAEPNEFVRIIKRHTPFISARQEKVDERSFSQTTILLYVRKEEQDRLNELEKMADPIIYIRWHTKIDPRTGRSIRDGDVEIWFLRSSGNWIFVRNERIAIQFLTENVGNGKPRNVLAGRQYRVGDAYHILKADRNGLVRLAEGGG